MDCLFVGQDVSAVNVKFFRGSKDIITPDELREEVHSALLQARSKSVVAGDVPPKSSKPKVDVRSFVADM